MTRASGVFKSESGRPIKERVPGGGGVAREFADATLCIRGAQSNMRGADGRRCQTNVVEGQGK